MILPRDHDTDTVFCPLCGQPDPTVSADAVQRLGEGMCEDCAVADPEDCKALDA